MFPLTKTYPANNIFGTQSTFKLYEFYFYSDTSDFALFMRCKIPLLFLCILMGKKMVALSLSYPNSKQFNCDPMVTVSLSSSSCQLLIAIYLDSNTYQWSPYPSHQVGVDFNTTKWSVTASMSSNPCRCLLQYGLMSSNIWIEIKRKHYGIIFQKKWGDFA